MNHLADLPPPRDAPFAARTARWSDAVQNGWRGVRHRSFAGVAPVLAMLTLSVAAVAALALAHRAYIGRGGSDQGIHEPAPRGLAFASSPLTDTELLVLESGVRELLPEPIPCLFYGQDGLYEFECQPAAGHHNSGSIQRLADEDEARRAFESAARGRPRTCLFGYLAAEWEHRQGTDPGMPMRTRHHLSAAGRWSFWFAGFDDTAYDIAAHPRTLAERVYRAAAAQGMFPLGECQPTSTLMLPWLSRMATIGSP